MGRKKEDYGTNVIRNSQHSQHIIKKQQKILVFSFLSLSQIAHDVTLFVVLSLVHFYNPLPWTWVMKKHVINCFNTYHSFAAPSEECNQNDALSQFSGQLSTAMDADSHEKP